MKIQKVLPVIFLVFLAWGIFLRAAPISFSPLWMDEGASFSAAENLLKTGGITFPTGEKYGFFSVLFHFFEAISLFLFGQNYWGARFPSLVFSVLTAIFSLFAAQKLFPQKKLFSFLFFAAINFSAWEILWGGQGRMYAELQFFFLGAMFFFVRFFQKRDLKNLFFAAIFAVAAIFTHPFAISLFPIFAVGAAIFLGKKCFQKEFLMFLAAFSAVGFFLFFDFLSWLFSHFKNLSPFYFRWILDAHGTTLGLFLISVATIFRRGNDFEKKLAAFFLSAIFIVLSAISFFVPAANFRYLFPIFPLVVFLLFLGFSLFSKRFFPLAAIFIALFFLFEGQFLPKKNPRLEHDREKYENYRVFVPQPDFAAAHFFAKNRLKKNEIFVTAYPEIALFYGIKPDAVISFDLDQKKNWGEISRPKFFPIPYFQNLLKLNNFLKNRHGILLIDKYALEKLPAEFSGFLDANTDKIFEKTENLDSKIYLFRF